MKKWIAMVLSVLMMFTLAACGNTQNESDRTTSGSMTESQETKTPQEPESSTQPEEEDNSVVVIDGEVLGNTQYVAYVIQENTGADIFRIEPETPYPTDP